MYMCWLGELKTFTEVKEKDCTPKKNNCDDKASFLLLCDLFCLTFHFCSPSRVLFHLVPQVLRRIMHHKDADTSWKLRLLLEMRRNGTFIFSFQ